VVPAADVPAPPASPAPAVGCGAPTRFLIAHLFPGR
jgi:hypothetical protein